MFFVNCQRDKNCNLLPPPPPKKKKHDIGAYNRGPLTKKIITKSPSTWMITAGAVAKLDRRSNKMIALPETNSKLAACSLIKGCLEDDPASFLGAANGLFFRCLFFYAILVFGSVTSRQYTLQGTNISP